MAPRPSLVWPLPTPVQGSTNSGWGRPNQPAARSGVYFLNSLKKEQQQKQKELSWDKIITRNSSFRVHKQVYWSTGRSVCSRAVYGSFHATTAKANSCDRNRMAWNINNLFLYRKSLLTPILAHAILSRLHLLLLPLYGSHPGPLALYGQFLLVLMSWLECHLVCMAFPEYLIYRQLPQPHLSIFFIALT